MKLPKTLFKSKHLTITMQKTNRQEKIASVTFLLLVVGLVSYLKIR